MSVIYKQQLRHLQRYIQACTPDIRLEVIPKDNQKQLVTLHLTLTPGNLSLTAAQKQTCRETLTRFMQAVAKYHHVDPVIVIDRQKSQYSFTGSVYPMLRVLRALETNRLAPADDPAATLPAYRKLEQSFFETAFGIQEDTDIHMADSLIARNSDGGGFGKGLKSLFAQTRELRHEMTSQAPDVDKVSMLMQEWEKTVKRIRENLKQDELYKIKTTRFFSVGDFLPVENAQRDLFDPAP